VSLRAERQGQRQSSCRTFFRHTAKAGRASPVPTGNYCASKLPPATSGAAKPVRQADSKLRQPIAWAGNYGKAD